MKLRNRGKQSNDENFFSSKWHPTLKEAVDDLCFLLTRGYGASSSLKLVGNRYRLNKRQHLAIARISHSDQAIELRNNKALKDKELTNKSVEIDGFNLLILMESYLSEGYILKGRDGVFRDIASVHGTYKKVMKTDEALIKIGTALKELNISSVKWYLDQPISNSGSLKSKLLEVSNEHSFNWDVELVLSPDKVLAKSQEIVISSDGWILDNATQWYNLGAYLIEKPDENLNIIQV
ncbi:DUF434 domain-containing protein [Flammeovirga sp. SJP92]|uniref:DUF434 domain-containing protein n=1 Tax=Flammeovirga sp. SJP92 TaxID=1775430 RepID=UPI000788454C|nr:DUF434 domain-containing protein [Flammeovirga sp. SJP92]KXX67460.1 hypothetical protein AVL50_29580 [Flammeovirga sp. SJP92]